MQDILSFDFLSLFLVVGVVQMVALVSPGPDFAIVARNSLLYSMRTAIWTIIGIALGVLFHATYVLIGLSVLQEVFPQFLIVLKWLAALYLFWLGVSSLLSGIKLYRLQKKYSVEAHQASSSTWQNISSLHAFRQGLFTNILNPKVIIYFTSFFAAVIEPDLSLFARSILGLEIVALTFLWFSLVATVLSKATIQQLMMKWKFLIEWVFGVVFIVFSIIIVTTNL